MKEELTIKHVQDLKSEMENNIRDLLNQFQKETGIIIQSISFESINMPNCGISETVTKVQCKVEF